MEKIEVLHKEVDCLDKEANVIHKKLFVLLAVGAGSGSILFQTKDSLLFSIMLIVFLFIALATFINYWKLGIIRDDINKINFTIKRIINE